MAAQSARPDAPGSGALAAAAGPKGKGKGDAMQDRPLRCQHAADGRKVLGRDGAASPGNQGGVWQSRGRNLTALGADGAPTTRENLALRAP